MPFQWSRAAEVPPTDQLLVWGKSGTGKTAALVRAAADMDLTYADVADGLVKPVGDKGVFLLAFERNAIATARTINPDCGTFLAETYDRAVEVIQAARAGELIQAGFTRLAIDGLTELQKLIGDTMSQSDPTYWNVLIQRTGMMLRTLRSIPMHVACSALEQQKENERTRVVDVAPQFGGRSVPDTATSMMVASGRATRTGEGSDERYVVDFSLNGRYLVKANGSLRGRVKPCVAAWLEVLSGQRDPNSIRDGQPEAEAVPVVVDNNAAPAAGRRIAR